jgi:hypothetical protein
MIIEWTGGTVKQESKKDFIVQNFSAKKWLQAGKILQCTTALWRSGKEWLSCLNILIHPCHAKLYYLLIKTKLIPFIYCKNCDTAFSNTMRKIV